MMLQLAERLPPDAAAYATQFWRGGMLAIPSLFAAEEVAWLAEEAKLVSARLTGRPKQDADGALIDVDVHEEPFRRLAAHPRLLDQLRELLPEPFGVLRTRLVLREPAEAPAQAGVTVAVHLAGPEAGTVVLLHGGSRDALPPRRGPLYLITYAPISRGSTRGLDAGLNDDCLWPPAFACAG
jgi:hypothetical protein